MHDAVEVEDQREDDGEREPRDEAFRRAVRDLELDERPKGEAVAQSDHKRLMSIELLGGWGLLSS